MVKITCTLYITVLTILTEHAFSYGKGVCMITFILSRVMLKETFVSMGTFWEPFEPPGQAGSHSAIRTLSPTPFVCRDGDHRGGACLYCGEAVPHPDGIIGNHH